MKCFEEWIGEGKGAEDGKHICGILLYPLSRSFRCLRTRQDLQRYVAIIFFSHAKRLSDPVFSLGPEVAL